MSLRAAIAAVLLSALPLTAAAQQSAVVPEARGALVDRLLQSSVAQTARDAEYVPVWASPDGRLLAVVALSRDGGAPVQPLVPNVGGVADWRVIDATALASGGLRWQLGQGLRADATVSSYSAQPFWLTCGTQSTGPCMADSGDAARGPLAFIGNIVLGWTGFDNNVDLSYGLSWLQSRDRVGGTNAQFGGATLAGDAFASGLPMLVVPGLGVPHQLETGSALSAQGRWKLGVESGLDFGASVGRGHVILPGISLPTNALDLSQTSLSVGVDSGSLRGSIVGHLLSSDQAVPPLGKRWTSLDLGVSWRTPWRGELSVGAQNLWSAPLDPAVKDVDSAQTRTPYVQYRQDL